MMNVVEYRRVLVRARIANRGESESRIEGKANRDWRLATGARTKSALRWDSA